MHPNSSCHGISLYKYVTYLTHLIILIPRVSLSHTDTPSSRHFLANSLPSFNGLVWLKTKKTSLASLTCMCCSTWKEEYQKLMSLPSENVCLYHGKILMFFALLSLLELEAFSLAMTLESYLELFCTSEMISKRWIERRGCRNP
ncbi:hypothetical protein E2542_SST01746 [Spatholobus suberectus]|nr:hypothetical protein E2542_SST01746 [Spatholobus suberectus]